MEDGSGSSGIGPGKSIGLAEGILLPAEAVESNRSRPMYIGPITIVCNNVLFYHYRVTQEDASRRLHVYFPVISLVMKMS